MIILDLVTTCITRARQIKSGKLIIWLNLAELGLTCNVFKVPCRQLLNLVDTLDLKQYKVRNACIRSRSVVYIRNRRSGRKPTMTVVLKILTNRFTTFSCVKRHVFHEAFVLTLDLAIFHLIYFLVVDSIRIKYISSYAYVEKITVICFISLNLKIENHSEQSFKYYLVLVTNLAEKNVYELITIKI